MTAAIRRSAVLALLASCLAAATISAQNNESSQSASSAAESGPTVLERVEALGLTTSRTGRLTTWFAPKDQARAAELARLVASAAGHFERELGLSLDLRMAALPEGRWLSYNDREEGSPFTIPWGSVEEQFIIVPASGARLPGTGFPRAIDFIALHEYGHTASEKYFASGQITGYGDVLWFWELLATYFGYAFVAQSDPAWADSLRHAWRGILAEFTPREITLDWAFMRELPPEELGPTYGWYQTLLNLRVAELHDEHGLAFLQRLKGGLDWDQSGEWTNETLLPRLEKLSPGFLGWASDLTGELLSSPVAPPTPATE